MKTMSQKRKPYVSAAKKRYDGIRRRLAGMRSIPVDVQKEVAWTFNDIDQYGFRVWANHYLFEKLDHLEQVINKVDTVQHQSQ